MKPKNPLDTQMVLKIILGIAMVVFVVLTALLYQQYQQIRHLEYAGSRYSFFQSLHRSRQLTVADATSTQAWMTFDYINRVFVIPPAYMQTTLSITDSKYPRLTIAQYAKDTKLTSPIALAKVQDAIVAFFSTTTKP